MAENMRRREIGKEIYLTRLTDKKAKFNVVSVNFITPVSEETASEYEVLTKVLRGYNSKYPLLNKKLSSLYGARLDFTTVKLNDTLIVSLTAEYMDGRYAFDNENMGAEAVKVLLSCIFEPCIERDRFSPQLTEAECRAALSQFQAEKDNLFNYAGRRALEILFEGEPAAVNGSLKEEAIKNITPKSLYKAYKRLLTHCRAEIICVGGSDFEEETRVLSEKFSELRREEIFLYKSKTSPLKNKVRRITEKTEATQSILIMGYKTDFENEAALRVLNEMLNEYKLREKLPLCYFCYSYFNFIKGALWIESGIEGGKSKSAEEEIGKMLLAFAEGEFSDDDIENAKAFRSGILSGYNDNAKYIGAWYLARIFEDNIKSPEDVIEEDKKVTKGDIIKAAKSLNSDTVYLLLEKKRINDE